jgi:hypothetical protein
MSAGCLTLGRSLLSKASWLADTAEEEQLAVIEDPRVIASENSVYEGLAVQATPFITTLDEVSPPMWSYTSGLRGRGVVACSRPLALLLKAFRLNTAT